MFEHHRYFNIIFKFVDIFFIFHHATMASCPADQSSFFLWTCNVTTFLVIRKRNYCCLWFWMFYTTGLTLPLFNEVPVPTQDSELSCICVAKALMFASFYGLDIWFWNCWKCGIFFLHFIEYFSEISLPQHIVVDFLILSTSSRLLHSAWLL